MTSYQDIIDAIDAILAAHIAYNEIDYGAQKLMQSYGTKDKLYKFLPEIRRILNSIQKESKRLP